MKNYLLILLILTLIGAINIRNKRVYRYTLDREQNLVVEVYRAGSTGNLTSEYLTDSANFRVYLGTFNNTNDYHHYKVKGDRFMIEKLQHERNFGTNANANRTVLPERKTLNLAELKHKHRFD